MKKILKKLREPIILDTICIFIGFLLFLIFGTEKADFQNLINVILAVIIFFLAIHFEQMKELVKRKEEMRLKESEEQFKLFKEQFEWLYEFVLMAIILYLIFLRYSFGIVGLEYFILSLSFGLSTALIISLFIS